MGHFSLIFEFTQTAAGGEGGTGQPGVAGAAYQLGMGATTLPGDTDSFSAETFALDIVMAKLHTRLIRQSDFSEVHFAQILPRVQLEVIHNEVRLECTPMERLEKLEPTLASELRNWKKQRTVRF